MIILTNLPYTSPTFSYNTESYVSLNDEYFIIISPAVLPIVDTEWKRVQVSNWDGTTHNNPPLQHMSQIITSSTIFKKKKKIFSLPLLSYFLLPCLILTRRASLTVRAISRLLHYYDYSLSQQYKYVQTNKHHYQPLPTNHIVSLFPLLLLV